MIMNRILAIIVMLLGLQEMAVAQSSSHAYALDNAKTFASQLKGGTVPAEVEQVRLPLLKEVEAYNIMGGGFVVASCDKRTRPILAYSATGNIDADDLPDGFAYWLSEYEHQIAQLGSTPLDELHKAYTPPVKETADLPDSVAPMLATAWNQYRYGYNSMAPYDSVLAADSMMARFEGRPTVGCVALAMGQIMRYWQFPQHGLGSHSYTHQGEYDCWRYGTLYADFANATYHYADMPYQLTDSSSATEVEAVATLLSHCGISANMMYNSDCQGSSGAQITSALMGFQHYFHYSPNAAVAYKIYSSTADWIQMLKEDIGNGRPVFYCGQSSRNDADSTIEGAHAFVFDGYDSQDYFHVNWGWNGRSNGYYSVDVLRPLTQYNFSSFQYCIFGLEPAFTPIPLVTMASDLTLSRYNYGLDRPVRGTYSLTNIGDTVSDTYFGVNVYSYHDYYGCLDGRHIILQPGDTVECHFAYDLDLPEGSYTALMQYSADSFYAGIPFDETSYYADPDHVFEVEFTVSENPCTEYTNLAVFVSFADDEPFSKNMVDMINLFNNGTCNVADYFNEMSYGQIQFRTKFADQYEGATIVPYVDPHPRGYYQPYSADNPLGYTRPNPMISISTREAELIARVCRYIDSLHLVQSGTTLDGDNDGDIDNLSLIIQGEVGAWAELLWPHMEFFPHDSVGYTVTINGKRINAFNFEFESSYYFALRTFAHEMGHSIGLPDLYHYYNHTGVYPVYYDVMGVQMAHPSAVYKHFFLDLTEPPTQITSDGTYTINSLNSSAVNHLYYIKSAIDSNQWYTIEYRTPDQKYESSIPEEGLIIGRWADTITHDIYHGGNAFYDFHTIPNAYWVFRPGSDIDSLQGETAHCYFSQASGRQSFGPTTDPHPYLTDGTPEESFEIYDITENGSTCTFSVRFITHEEEGIAPTDGTATASVYPNPTSSSIHLSGIPQGTPVKIYNTLGAVVLTTIYWGESISLEALPEGLYMLATPTFTCKINKVQHF